jgi:hypothetical protein
MDGNETIQINGRLSMYTLPLSCFELKWVHFASSRVGILLIHVRVCFMNRSQGLWSEEHDMTSE